MDIQFVKDALVDNIYNEYKLLVSNRFYADDFACVTLYKMLIKSIATFCVVCGYVPDGMTEDEINNAADGTLTLSACQTILSDVVVTEGLRNTKRPINTEVIYQIVYDRSYRFIPLDQRPKPDFMNPPE